jgi:ADP-heptose:LPS heptosyltransferase
MGDVAMLVPVLRVLIEQNKGVKITVLSRKFLKPIFNSEILGSNINFHEADTKGKHKGFFGILKLAKEIRKVKINMIADTHNVLRSKMLRFFLSLNGIKNRSIDKGRSQKKALVDHKIFEQLKTTHERYADVFRALGFQVDLSKHQFPKKPELPQLPFLINTVEDGKKWIGIAPFAQYQGKMYPLDLMVKVIEKLAKTNRIFLFGGGKKEVDLLNNIAYKYENAINVAGKLSLKEELSLISHLDCMLSMDSGNAHFAAMLGVKTITIWGVTHPFAGFAPFQQQENCVLPDLDKYPKIPCSIYGNKVCDGYEDVMRSVSPEMIINRIMY